MYAEHRWNVYVGGTTGIFKGLTVTHNGLKKVKNLVSIKNVNNKKEMTCMNWADSDEDKILMGYCDQTVRIYDIEANTFVFDSKLNCGEGSVKGISQYNSKLLTGAESGEVKLWNIEDGSDVEECMTIKTGGPLDKLHHSSVDQNCIATGGKENDLKLWDLETGATTFAAKNVRPDELQLRVPVWVSDIAFIPESTKVAVASKYGFVRLYDPKSSFRRPVLNVKVPDQALTCITTAPRDEHVLVGSGTGHMFLVDLRQKGILLNHYKGFVGGIKQIACPRSEPVIVSVGLDRHIRVHDLNSKQLVVKEYLQSRLTCLLLSSYFTMTKIKEEIEEDTKVSIKVEKDEEHENNDEELDAIFDGMETVIEKQKFKKIKEEKIDSSSEQEEVKEEEEEESSNSTFPRGASGLVKRKKAKQKNKNQRAKVLKYS